MKKEILIENFVVKELNQKVKNWFIIQNTENEYLLFNEFKIVKTNVNFEVHHTKNSLCFTFFSLKNAVTYCICEKFKKYYDSECVKNLDRRLENYSFSQELHKRLFDKCKEGERKLVYLHKFQEDIAQKKKAAEEMNYFISLSRQWLNEKLNSIVK